MWIRGIESVFSSVFLLITSRPLETYCPENCGISAILNVLLLTPNHLIPPTPWRESGIFYPRSGYSQIVSLICTKFDEIAPSVEECVQSKHIHIHWFYIYYFYWLPFISRVFIYHNQIQLVRNELYLFIYTLYHKLTHNLIINSILSFNSGTRINNKLAISHQHHGVHGHNMSIANPLRKLNRLPLRLWWMDIAICKVKRENRGINPVSTTPFPEMIVPLITLSCSHMSSHTAF